MKRNPWANRFKGPPGPRVQPLVCRKYGFRIVNNCVTPQVTETYESLKEHQKNNLETEI